MNLIEQLGGYEHLNGFYKRAVAHGFTLTEIKEELLKYRRQHNVYEADDLVVFVDEKERKPVLLKFKESRNFDLVHLEIIGSGLCGSSYQKEIRHATDEEIKAGKRLEVS